MIVYDEPIPGLDEFGDEVTCNRQVSVTKQDAIRIQRWVMREMLKKRELEYLTKKGVQYTLLDIPSEDLLDEYTLVHWATHSKNTPQ